MAAVADQTRTMYMLVRNDIEMITAPFFATGLLPIISLMVIIPREFGLSSL